MRIVVFGASGLVGSNVAAEGFRRDMDVVGTYYSTVPELPIPVEQCDIREEEQVRDILDNIRPDVVFNCVAKTDVDACESDTSAAKAINATAPERLAETCRKRDIALVHFSTDYVFDGETDDTYDENASPNPRQVYGRTKLAGDRGVLRKHDEAIVARLSFVYGRHQVSETLTGFPAWVRDSLRSGETIPLFTDQWVTPSRAGQVAQTSYDLLQDGYSGLINIASQSCLTPYEFGERIAAVMDTNPTFTQSKQSEISRDAPRPRRTCLSVDLVENILGRAQPTVSEDLEAISDLF